MTHPFLTAIALLLFWSFIISVVNNMTDDKNAIIRFIGYAIALILAIATVLFVLTQYLGVKF